MKLWLSYALARRAGEQAARIKRKMQPVRLVLKELDLRKGVSVVIPSRSGRMLLERLLPTLYKALGTLASEVIVVDNGSDDGTTEWLRREYGDVLLLDSSSPLSFATAVNRGIQRAAYQHTVLLNNDMVVEPDFFNALLHAFDAVPNLFCATAQIFFPEGKRREETGIAVLRRECAPEDFPVTCLIPEEGDDLRPVTYGSGGCSMYHTAKLRALGGMGEVFQPAYVEDLDLGWRGWTAGWPTVFVAAAYVTHHHRATTSRYFSEAQIREAVECNYLQFLARSVADSDLFLELWTRAITRMKLFASEERETALRILQAARQVPEWVEAPVGTNGMGYFGHESIQLNSSRY